MSSLREGDLVEGVIKARVAGNQFGALSLVDEETGRPAYISDTFPISFTKLPDDEYEAGQAYVDAEGKWYLRRTAGDWDYEEDYPWIDAHLDVCTDDELVKPIRKAT